MTVAASYELTQPLVNAKDKKCTKRLHVYKCAVQFEGTVLLYSKNAQRVTSVAFHANVNLGSFSSYSFGLLFNLRTSKNHHAPE